MAGQKVRTSTVRRNTASIRPPAPVVPDDSIPPWLKTSAGWAWRLIVVTIAVALIVFATSRVQLVFIALFLALVITAVLRPLVGFYSKIMPRALATALALLSGILVVGGLLAYVVASVVGQWQKLSDQFANGTNQILDFLENGPLPFTITVDDLRGWVDDGQEWVQDHAGDIAGTAFEQAGTVVEVFTCLALAIFCTIFFLARGESMWAWFINQLPIRFRETWTIVGGAGWYTFSGYTRGTVIIALTDGIFAGIFLSILGVPLAAPLAVLVFIGAFIPLIGAPLAMVVAMVVALAADNVWKAAIVGVGIALIGQFEGHVLQPLIMGKQVSLHPIVVAISVACGTLLAGILGAVIAVPIVAVVWAVFSKLRHLDPPTDADEIEEEDFAPDDDNQQPEPDRDASQSTPTTSTPATSPPIAPAPPTPTTPSTPPSPKEN